MRLRDTDVDTVELPSSYTKRKVFERYVFSRGYKIKANSAGIYPKKDDWPVRDFDEVDWPVGSTPRPVPSDNYFHKYWKNNFNNLWIKKTSRDTCNECWKVAASMKSVRMKDSYEAVENFRDRDAEVIEESDLEMDISVNSNDEHKNPEECVNQDIVNDTNNSNHTSDYTICPSTDNMNLCWPCSVDNDSNKDTIHPLVLLQENIMEQGYKHVQQYKAMRQFTDKKYDLARQLEDQGVEWIKK